MDQARASREQARSNLEQSRAVLRHTQDVLRKTTYTAPIDGIVSYIAVRVGENVVPGIQGTRGQLHPDDFRHEHRHRRSESRRDRHHQRARTASRWTSRSTLFPDKVFKGHVTEVGELAILRTSGQASMTETTANTQEARDFKVVVTLDNPPGLACARAFPPRPRFKRRRSRTC